MTALPHDQDLRAAYECSSECIAPLVDRPSHLGDTYDSTWCALSLRGVHLRNRRSQALRKSGLDCMDERQTSQKTNVARQASASHIPRKDCLDLISGL